MNDKLMQIIHMQGLTDFKYLTPRKNMPNTETTFPMRNAHAHFFLKVVCILW